MDKINGACDWHFMWADGTFVKLKGYYYEGLTESGSVKLVSNSDDGWFFVAPGWFCCEVVVSVGE